MSDTTPANPYQPVTDDDGLPLAPFVGRQKAFERLYQPLTDPKAGAAVILGRRRVGKTALLQHFHPAFDESFVSVYVPLRQMPPDDESAWLKALARRAMTALAERGFTLSHLPGEPPAEGDIRAWFGENFLPEVLTIIRRYRRLIILMDDADSLIRAVQGEQADETLFGFFEHLMEKNVQFRIVMTLDVEYEADIATLRPLASLTGVFRLTNLSPDDSLQLLQEPAQPFYTVTPEAAAAVYQAAGGQPQLLQRFGYHLFRLYQDVPTLNAVTEAIIKQVMPAVYAGSEADFRQVWQGLNQNEQLVLRAMIGLLYEDPLTAISTEALAAWFVETDFPLDSTAIHAALRSLEYRELVSAAPVQISSGLMQTWLLDNIRRTPPVVKAAPGNPAASPRKNRRRLVAAGLAGLILLVLLILVVLTPPQGAAEIPLQPTVTLVTTPAQP